MKLFNKRFLILMLSLTMVMVSNTLVFASEADDKEQINSIKMAIEGSFERHKPALELDKNNFGLSASESFSNAILGEGVPYYVVSSDFLNNEQNAELLSHRGYIFPIKVGNKSAGIVFVQKINDKYDIVGMQNYLKFEEDISNAKKVFNDNMPTELVYDIDLHLCALANKSKSNIVPILDNQAYELKKNQNASLETVAEKVRKQHNKVKQNPERFGGDSHNTDNASQGKYYIITGVSIIILCAIFFVVMRIRKNVA